jgi:hypothetical protein
VFGIGTGEGIMSRISASVRGEGPAMAECPGSTGFGGDFAGGCSGPAGSAAGAFPVEGRLPSFAVFIGCEDARPSVSVWNFVISSFRVVFDAPLPFWSWSGRAFTATNPRGVDGEDCVMLVAFDPRACAGVPFIKATLDGLEGRIGGPGLAVARLSRIACFLPLSLWLS